MRLSNMSPRARRAELRARLVIALLVTVIVFAGMTVTHGVLFALRAVSTAAAIALTVWFADRMPDQTTYSSADQR